MPVTLFNGADHLRNEPIFREQFLHFKPARQITCGVLHCAQDICYDSLDVTMSRNISIGLSDDVRDVALIGAYVEEWSFDRQYVVDFAGVDYTYVRLPHHDHVEIGCRQRSRVVRRFTCRR